VKESVDIADVRYAVVEALRTEGASERFVVAYHNEYCLYDLIAAPRIVAFGFSSREAAVASTKTRLSTTTEQKKVPRTPVVEKIRQVLTAFYSDGIAAAILVFSSRNIISSAIRTFLAVSF
jgi:hypothetical protein